MKVAPVQAPGSRVAGMDRTLRASIARRVNAAGRQEPPTTKATNLEQETPKMAEPDYIPEPHPLLVCGLIILSGAAAAAWVVWSPYVITWGATVMSLPAW